MQVDKDVWVALVGLFSTIIATLFAYKQSIKLKKMELEASKKDNIILDQQKNFSALSLLMDFELIDSIKKRVDLIFDKTNVDRFIILIAVNGKTDFNLVSVIYEQHKIETKINAVSQYGHVYIDDHYRRMIKEIEKNGSFYFETDRSYEVSYLNNIYLKENVKSSLIKFIQRVKIDENNDMIVFCSLASRTGLMDESIKNHLHADWGNIHISFKKYFKKLEQWKQ